MAFKGPIDWRGPRRPFFQKATGGITTDFSLNNPEIRGAYNQECLKLGLKVGNVDQPRLMGPRAVALTSRGPSERFCRLCMAAQNDERDLVETLLDEEVPDQVEVNESTTNGKTALQIAAEAGHTKFIQLLLEKKADLNKADNYGRTPLYWASRFGHQDACTALLEAESSSEIDVDKPDNLGWTALHHAARYGHQNIVDSLLGAKANPNAVDMYGQTPLHWSTGNAPLSWSASSGQVAAVASLLEHGADVNRMDNMGRTPQRWSEIQGASSGTIDIHTRRRNVDQSQFMCYSF